jgi:hypothetical protein
MVTDVLRSCYVGVWKVYTDPLTPLQTVRWFFTPPGTPVYDGPTAFTPASWFANSGIPEADVGEFSERFQAWSQGLPPPVTFTLHPLGSEPMFQQGVPLPPDPPLPCAVEGVPTAVVV